MQTTIWENGMVFKGTENLFCDMMAEEDTAEFFWIRFWKFHDTGAFPMRKRGVDVIYFGDDIGMQQTIMMSEELYGRWLEAKAHPACGHGEGH